MTILCINIDWTDPSIIGAVISGGCTIAIAIGAVLFFKKKKSIELEFENKGRYYQIELDNRGRDIQNKLDTKLELLRIEYSILYTKRIDVIKIIHKHLLNLKKVMVMFETLAKLNMDKEAFNTIYPNEDGQVVFDFINEFNLFENYFNENKIFLSKELADKIFAYRIYYIFSTVMKTSYYQEYAEKIKHISNDTYGLLNSFASIIKETDEELKDGVYSINDILTDIEDEFRSLIGADIKRK